MSDGDSLRLADGTRIRLVGINTPEFGRDSQPDEPFALRARALLRKLIEEQGHGVHLKTAIEPRDRYGRMLAHAYLADGNSLQEQLLESGLGLITPHPPNLENLDCYRLAEAKARDRRRGLWEIPPSRATDLGRLPGGSFVRTQGRVTRLRHTRSSVWLDMTDTLSLRIGRTDLAHFDLTDLEALVGRNVEVRGWLGSRPQREPARMRIRHPAALRLLY